MAVCARLRVFSVSSQRNMSLAHRLTPATSVIATIAVVAALYSASSVFAPIAFALFIIAIVWPLQCWLQTLMPKLLALAIVLLVTMVVCVGFGSLVAWSFGRVGQWLVGNAGQFQTVYAQVTEWLEKHGVLITELWSEHFNVGWLMKNAKELISRANTTLTFWLVVVLYVMLGLLEVDDFRQRVHGMRNRSAAAVILNGSRRTAVQFRKFMLVRTLMSVITGALVWAFAKLVGLPLAAEWGVIAFVLNYIPYIGPFIATLLPTCFALGQFGSWQTVLAVFGGLQIIQFIVGGYVEPRVSGSVLNLSPVVVLFAVFLWTFLWGISGSFIGVPITIATLCFCAEHSSTRWLASLLGSQGDLRESSRNL
jgi:AI-2 transport protein TqsA